MLAVEGTDPAAPPGVAGLLEERVLLGRPALPAVVVMAASQRPVLRMKRIVPS